MKKLFFAIFTLILLNLSLNAITITTKCPQWEHGEIVYYNGVQQNINGSTPPNQFCWDTVAVQGLGLLPMNDGSYEVIYFENTTSNQTSAYWFGSAQYTLYGIDYYGLFVSVVVMGVNQKEPFVRFGTTHGELVGRQDILSPSGNIWNGYIYTYFIRKIPVDQFTGILSEISMNGEVKVYNGKNINSLEDYLFIK